MKQMFAVLVLGALLLAACGAQPTAAPTEPAVAPTEVPATQVPTQPPPTPVPTATIFESPLDMANPASKFCEEQGYRLEMRTEAGGTAGYCIFPDGSECEEWAFYRGECQPGTTFESPFESPIGLPNPASKFCEDQGYRLELRTEAGGTVGYCIFPDGSECEEWAFYREECAPGTGP
jgi:putative hemolysin